MIRKTFILLVIIFSFQLINAQNNYVNWFKISTELKFKFDDSPFEIRLRPDDHIFLPGINIARTDLMAGVKFKNITVFAYSKFDELGGAWLGPRLDFNAFPFEKKMLIHLQGRYFFGLNPDSENHFYFINIFSYEIAKFMSVGILGYGKWEENQSFNNGIWFMGPLVDFKFPKNFVTSVAYTKDIFSPDILMLYLKFSYKIHFHIKNKEEN